MKILKDHDIICFGPSDWWGMNPSSATHIMQRLAKTNRILYINPISSDLLGMSNRKGVATRILRKLKSMMRIFKRADHNLFVMSPFFLPIQGNPFLDRINNIMLRIQIGLTMLLLGFKHPLLWVENIRAADSLTWFNWHLIIYHASDKFDECANTRNKLKLQHREKLVSQHSDVIICASNKLYESKREQKTHVHYLPHGVDFELFCKAANDTQFHDDLKHSPHAVAGYFGTLTAQNDIELLEHCAASLSHVRFVFAGQVTGGDYDRLNRMPNVSFLGHVPYEQIPHLCASFDVCLLPWRMNAWIESCNPLKLFEYMASGNPIVSVPICEVKDRYSDIVAIAENKDQFCRAIETELDDDTDRRKTLRIETAKQHSWNNHILRLSGIINDAMQNKPPLNV